MNNDSQGILEKPKGTERDIRELYTDAEGRSKLRKNSDLGETKNLEEIANSIFKLKGHTVVICDSDMYYTELSKVKTYLGEHITRALYEKIQELKPVHINNCDMSSHIPLSNDEDMYELVEQYICPITKGSKAAGAIIILTKKSEDYDDKSISEEEMKLAEASSRSLSSIINLIN